MPLRFKSLTLKRFRSVISSELSFGNPTFLIGRNGAGKSNIVDALSFLADAVTNPLEVAFDKRGGIESVRNRGSGPGYPPNLGFRVEFDGSYAIPKEDQRPVIGDFAFEIRAKGSGGFEVVRERCFLSSPNGPDQFYDRKLGHPIDSTLPFLREESWQSIAQGYLLLPWMGGIHGFREVNSLLAGIRAYSIDPSQLRRPQDPEVGYMLRSDGSNAGSVLKNLERTDPPAVSQICDLLAQITPKTSGIKTVKHGKQLTLEFQQKWGENKKLKFEAYSASDGTLRALGILIALMQKPPATLLVIEEPESSLHPGALDALLQVIQSRAEHLQVLITTHSSDLLDAKWLKPENLRLVMWDGGSEIKPVSARAVKMLRSHLATAGELMRADALEEPLPLPLPLPQLQVHPEFNLFPDHK